MKRLFACAAISFLLLSACDRGTITSPVEPEMADVAFSMMEMPSFEPPLECPAASCFFGPVTLDRDTKAPSVLSETFPGEEGQAATLVILSSNPKTTTVKAWLNDVVVLLPSALPREKSDEVRVPVTLLEINTLEVRLSAKPGTQIAIWVQIPEGDPPPIVFQLTEQTFGLTDDLSGACTGFGAGYQMADWTEVKPAVEGGWAAKEDVMTELTALILNEGEGLFYPVFPIPGERHWVLSAVDTGSWIADSAAIAETEVFWLTSLASATLPPPLPVLCSGPQS